MCVFELLVELLSERRIVETVAGDDTSWERNTDDIMNCEIFNEKVQVVQQKGFCPMPASIAATSIT